MNWSEIVKNINMPLVTFMGGKYMFRYDWFKNPSIFGLYAGSGSNDSFAFSKGDIVNAVSLAVSYPADAPVYDENSVLIENVKFDSTQPESFLNTKTIQVPLEYLQKVDDSTPITFQTGINYGKNFKPSNQGGGKSIILPNPVFPVPKPDVKTPIKAIADQLIEQNSTYVLNKDFGYNKTDNTNENIIPDLRTLISGTKVTGNVFRPTVYYKAQAGVYIPENRFDYLEVKGLTDSNSLKIPLLNLIKYIPTNSGAVVPENIDNKKLLMIIGAFLAGYVLFGKGSKE
jgi:hypothetical protein